MRFISEVTELCETMVRLMLRKLTAAQCIYTFILVRFEPWPARPRAGKQRATHVYLSMHKWARTHAPTMI